MYSYLNLGDASIGQAVEWSFQGPGGISVSESLIIELSGDVYVYAPVEPWLYEGYGGDWTVTVYVEGAEASTAYFTVEEPQGTGFGIGLPPYLNLMVVLAGVSPLHRTEKVLTRRKSPVPSFLHFNINHGVIRWMKTVEIN